jgi:hypothetical protein
VAQQVNAIYRFVGSNFADKRRSNGRSSLLADTDNGVFLSSKMFQTTATRYVPRSVATLYKYYIDIRSLASPIYRSHFLWVDLITGNVGLAYFFGWVLHEFLFRASDRSIILLAIQCKKRVSAVVQWRQFLWSPNYTNLKTFVLNAVSRWRLLYSWASVRKAIPITCSLDKGNYTPCLESASELYPPSDRRLSAKWVPTFADRGCHVVSATDPTAVFSVL